MQFPLTVPLNDRISLHFACQILRILLFREFWVGTVGSSAAEVAATVEETGMSKVRMLCVKCLINDLH